MDEKDALRRGITEELNNLPEESLADVGVLLEFIRYRDTTRQQHITAEKPAEPPEEVRKVFEKSSVEIFQAMSNVLSNHSLDGYHVNGVTISKEQTIICNLDVKCCNEICTCIIITCAK